MKYNKSALVLLSAFTSALFISAAPATADAFPFEIGVGLKGGVNGSAGPGISDNSTISDQNGNQFVVGNVEYHPHFGIGGSFGAVLELRALGVLGLETGLYYSRDNGQGWVDKNDGATGRTLLRLHSEQETTAYHFPVLLRANIPNPLIRPFIGVGFEFVRQSNSTISYRQEQQAGRYTDSDFQRIEETYLIAPSNYTLLLASLGMEIKVASMRIPIEVRAGYNLGFDDSLSARATFNSDTQQFTYDGAYQGHFGIFTGIIYDFDIVF